MFIFQCHSRNPECFREVGNPSVESRNDRNFELWQRPQGVIIIKELKPGVKIMAVSEYGYEAAKKDKYIAAFLKKPFESLELLSSARRVLDTQLRDLPLY